MREEDELIEQARESREKTEELRDERDGESRDAEPKHDSQPEPDEGEPWAKTSSGDAEHLADGGEP